MENYGKKIKDVIRWASNEDDDLLHERKQDDNKYCPQMFLDEYLYKLAE